MYPSVELVTCSSKFFFYFQRDCPDGRLSKSKFIEIYQQYYQRGQVTKFCEHAFRLFNKDGSGDLGKCSERIEPMTCECVFPFEYRFLRIFDSGQFNIVERGRTKN